ncbi:MAG: mechanosensitive ion channel family protein [Methanosarcinaceae archaeon]|nr:mechanosensitive ion channel family protein [Methanosarcinaceae archaeon]
MESIKVIFQNIPYQIKTAFLVILLGFIFYILFQYFLRKWFSKNKFLIKEIIVPFELLYGPIRFLFPSLCLLIIIPFLSIPPNIRILLNHFIAIWIIIGIAWLIIRIFAILKKIILSRYKLDVKDNLKARQISTQLSVIQRVLIVIIFIFAASAILMTFAKVRQIGVSILASAGVAGIIIGLAAQRSLATLIAGIQIAITQPIRIDDVVIVENEWGWIEEITLTYVVIRIWDQRRLVVPITYFIERPFQNWTKTTSELLGTVYLYADYGIPVDELRQELEKIVNASPLWDKRVAKIQVTNATEKTVEIRALISAENSSNAWELRCLVREKLIDFMQRNYPERLPRIRIGNEQRR